MKKLLIVGSIAVSFLVGTTVNIDKVVLAKMEKTQADIEVFKDKVTGCEYLISTDNTMQSEAGGITPRYFKSHRYETPQIKGCSFNKYDG